MNQTTAPRRSGLGRWLPLLVFALLAVLLGAGVWMSRNQNRDALPSPLIGKPAPGFTLPSLHEEGRIIKMEDLRGAPFLMNVWGSWCPQCQVEHPVLTRFAETKRVRVLGYNWKDDRADALRWLEQFGNPYWLVLHDPEGPTAIEWGIYGAPETFLVDGQGMIRWKYVGPLSDQVIADELEPVLARIEAGQ